MIYINAKLNCYPALYRGLSDCSLFISPGNASLENLQCQSFIASYISVTFYKSAKDILEHVGNPDKLNH